MLRQIQETVKEWEYVKDVIRDIKLFVPDDNFQRTIRLATDLIDDLYFFEKIGKAIDNLLNGACRLHIDNIERFLHEGWDNVPKSLLAALVYFTTEFLVYDNTDEVQREDQWIYLVQLKMAELRDPENFERLRLEWDPREMIQIMHRFDQLQTVTESVEYMRLALVGLHGEIQDGKKRLGSALNGMILANSELYSIFIKAGRLASEIEKEGEGIRVHHSFITLVAMVMIKMQENRKNRIECDIDSIATSFLGHFCRASPREEVGLTARCTKKIGTIYCSVLASVTEKARQEMRENAAQTIVRDDRDPVPDVLFTMYRNLVVIQQGSKFKDRQEEINFRRRIIHPSWKTFWHFLTSTVVGIFENIDVNSCFTF